jgi:ADP-heptose:LPS heptosyltransferase
MNTRNKIRIDQGLVKPLIFMLNGFVQLIGKILRLDHNLNKDFKIIAVAKYKGLGSIIQATPLLQTLRLQYPQAHIVFVTTKSNVAILQKIKCIDEIIFFDDKNISSFFKSFFPFIFRLIKLRVELYLDLEIYSNFSSLVTTISMARNRAGYFLRSSNYRLGIYTHMMYYNIRVPVSQTYLQFARLINCTSLVEDLYPLEVTLNSLVMEEEYLKSGKEKYILINPNASDLRLERRWEGLNFTRLINELQNKFSYKIILIGGKDEAEYVNQIYAGINTKSTVINLAGKTSIDDLLYLIKHASVFITNDTGPMHLSFSLQTKTIALFGPCSPEQYNHNKNCLSIYHKVYCSPCVHEFIIPPCGGDNQCMKLIKVEEVLLAVDKMLDSDKLIYMDGESIKGNIYESMDEKGINIPLGLIRRNAK